MPAEVFNITFIYNLCWTKYSQSYRSRKTQFWMVLHLNGKGNVFSTWTGNVCRHRCTVMKLQTSKCVIRFTLCKQNVFKNARESHQGRVFNFVLISTSTSRYLDKDAIFFYLFITVCMCAYKRDKIHWGARYRQDYLLVSAISCGYLA